MTVWQVAASESMRIDSGGNVGIGTSSPSNVMTVSSATQYKGFTLRNGTNTVADLVGFAAGNDSGGLKLYTAGVAKAQVLAAGNSFFNGGNVGIGTSSPSEKLDVVGNVTISGSLSKGSGSFRIDHPVKSDTHHLVHSFVEAPTADNIYRGSVALVDGVAKIDLDTAARLTSGTFEALNTNVDCWVSNKTGWTSVRATVSGSTLSIEAEVKTCTDIVSWLVIGERHDQTMIDADWTDAHGRVITEPKKETK